MAFQFPVTHTCLTDIMLSSAHTNLESEMLSLLWQICKEDLLAHLYRYGINQRHPLKWLSERIYMIYIWNIVFTFVVVITMLQPLCPLVYITWFTLTYNGFLLCGGKLEQLSVLYDWMHPSVMECFILTPPQKKIKQKPVSPGSPWKCCSHNWSEPLFQNLSQGVI